MLGIGGGIIVVPGLIGFAKMERRLAHGTSLAATLPIAIASLITYLAHGNVDWPVALFLAIGSIAGAIVGTHLLHVIPKNVLVIVFVITILATATRLLISSDSSGRADLTVASALVLVAVGFKPNSGGIGLKDAGVKLDDRGHIAVDDQMRTNVPSIFAIGDVAGMPYLAHKASKEGEIAAEVIAGHKSARDYRGMPAAIFTDPEIATVGLTESEAKAQGKKVKIGKFPFAASGRAMAVSETDGFIKVIIDEADNQLLGVAIVGPEASDLISESALALEMCAFAEDVALTVHPHPTLGEGVMEAFKHALGEAVHIMNRS